MIKNNKINEYGDTLIENKGMGSDIASQRMDALDNICVEHAIIACNKGNFSFIDVGCGRCACVNRIQEVTAEYNVKRNLDAIDIGDFSSSTVKDVKYIQGDMITELGKYEQNSIDIIYSQRTIHYLPYSQALLFLEQCNRILKSGGILIISASGITSELSMEYEHKKFAIDKRFTYLSDLMQEKHGIREKVCLYDMSELEKLINETGLTTQFLNKSDFGNIKAVGKK